MEVDLSWVDSHKPIVLMNGLRSFEKLVLTRRINEEDIQNIYPHLVTLFCSPSIYIRSLALKLFHQILITDLDSISLTPSPFPNLFKCLISPKQEIYSNAILCIDLLFNAESSDIWYPLCEKILFNSKSYRQKVHIMELLSKHKGVIPLRTLVKLLDDPIFQIQKIAEEMINEYDTSKIQEELNKSKNIQNNKQNEAKKKTNPLKNPRLYNFSPTKRSQETKENNKKQNKINVNKKQNSKRIKEQSIKSTSFNDEHSFYVNNEKFSNISDSENETMNITYNSIIKEEKSNCSQNPIKYKENESQTSHSKKNIQQSPTMRNKFSRMIKQPLAITLKDMKTLDFQTRKLKLKQIYYALVNNPNLKYSPDQLLDCVLTASQPNKIISKLIIKIISIIIVEYPEIIPIFLDEITAFLIQTKQLFQANDEVCDELIEALLVEISAEDLLTSILNKIGSNTHNIEKIIFKIYQINPNIKLNRNDLYHLLSFLFYGVYSSNQNNENIIVIVFKLFQIISENQQKLFADYVYQMPFDKRKILMSYIQPNIDKQQTKDILIGYDKNEDPFEVILKELKTNNECNFYKLVNAFKYAKFQSEEHKFNVFKKLILFLSHLSDETINENIEFIEKICLHFDSPMFLSILETNKITPPLITGLTIFLWNCNECVFNGAEKYYPVLYNLFCKMDGKRRSDIMLIWYLIQNETHISYDEFDKIPKPHQKLMLRLLDQFDNQ